MKHIFHLSKSYIFLIFIFATTVLFFFAYTVAEFYDTPISGFKDSVFIIAQMGIIFLISFSLISLISINKYCFAIVFPTLTLICTSLAYFRYTANVTLTPTIVELAIVNDLNTCMTMVSWELVLLLCLTLLFSAIIIYIRFRYVSISQKASIILFISALAILISTYSIKPLKRPITNKMPLNIIENIWQYNIEKREIATQRNTFPIAPICDEDSLSVVLIIGESLRADHIQMNGYNRETMPLLSKEKNLVSFPAVYSINWLTHTSIPYILTRANANNREIGYTESSFIPILKKGGFRTSWLANQEAVSTYKYFMNECDTLIYANSGKTVYTFDKWLDGDLIPIFKEELNGINTKKLMILHTIGSHWWYNSHFPDSMSYFKPIIQSRIVSSCTKNAMINSYDNTIRYTDTIIAQIINTLKTEKAILIYISDHGEILGEDGKYLHGEDHKELHNPGCFIWYSEKYAQKYPQKIIALKRNSLKIWDTSFLFHSILDATNAKTPYLDYELSIFK